ncbi:MAG: LLM class flavin-dependent oxidoreductase, partial [Anaerolineales bacterium]|nr:LLM class flavin-dependent oxidoreductase [Anaerolineales bacterium]
NWLYDSQVYSAEAIQQLQAQFTNFLAGLHTGDTARLADIQLLSAAELQQLLVDWNNNKKAVNRAATMHSLFMAQAARTPDATAIVFENQSMSYGELDRRTNQLAHELQRLGIGPEKPVGLFIERGLDMIVGLLGILKAGGAYLPLDPTYPSDRIAFMVEDAGVPVLLTLNHLVPQLPPHSAHVLRLDTDWAQIDRNSDRPVAQTSGPDNLSYLIYTSGSTGKPKGVMVQHRNVVNFLAGMDDHIPYEAGDSWLTVTSLSFDISVLEVFWSLSRGLKLVIYADKSREEADLLSSPMANKAVDFTLFYFSSDESEEGVPNKYHLLLEGAKYGDQNGFGAVWTPERHFHAFGGLYPNPAVTGAAIAAVTRNVQIRSGSCVLPLHSPIRVAEEWSVVDNMSNGRVGLSIAAGWQPNDFVLRPGAYADRKEIMFRDIEVVKELWRGGSVTMTNDLGKEVQVKTLPHPVQRELPIWITAAGNPETFREAGEKGYNLLTHLLGQSIEELADKIKIYREARVKAGHEGQGIVSLMLHTFISDDLDKVREIVRGPMKGYLSSAMNLVRQAAWHFPTFKEKAAATGKSPFEVFDEEELTPDDIDALLNFAFERYFETSGLFGTPQSTLGMVNKIKAIDVDDIACLIDFGIPSGIVLENLPYLNELRKLALPRDPEADFSIPALIERHEISHFQCTPSMGSMLTADERFSQAAARLKVCLMGGEAFPQALAKEITSIVNGKVLNVYGPTETTIWSSTCVVENGDRPVSIGRPLANQQMYIVDRQLQPVPVGVPGELLIGGDGVVRGYLGREELTADRFVPDHFRPDQPEAKLYRTGDLVRYRPDGNIEFLGRLDFQIKIRGYRVELGEIEALLNEHESVREAVVSAREDTPGDKRLVAYLIPRPGAVINANDLRDHLKQDLPDFMVPSHYVTMDKFPLTPNKKTDRKALPAPDQQQLKSSAVYAAPENDAEQKIAAIWQDLLGVEQIGVNDNFFDLGGHSLLAVQMHRMVKEAVEAELSITDIFRFPTIRALSNFLGNQEAEAAAAQQKVTDRAAARREAMANRRNRRR